MNAERKKAFSAPAIREAPSFSCCFSRQPSIVLDFVFSNAIKRKKKKKTRWEFYLDPVKASNSTGQGTMPAWLSQFWTSRNYVGLQRLQITVMGLARLCLASRKPLMKFRLNPCSFGFKNVSLEFYRELSSYDILRNGDQAFVWKQSAMPAITMLVWP